MSRPQHKTATFRFYAELNDSFEPRQRGRDLRCRFSGRPKVEEALEAFGVPLAEVEVIVIGGRSVGFDHRLEHEDRVAVYPMFEAVDVSPILRGDLGT